MSLTKVTYSMIENAPFNVVDYGADPTGASDSTSAIQAAISAAATNNGGTVYIPAGTYKITSTLTIQDSNIVIVGDGSVEEQNSGAVGSTSATILKWAGSSNEVMVNFLTPAGASNAKRSNQGLQKLELDGDGIAGTGIKIKSVNGLQLELLFIQNVTQYGIYTDCYDAGEINAPPDVQKMRWANINVWFLNGKNTTNAVGLFLSGSPAISVGGNTSGNYFENCRFQANGNSAAILDNADNNDFMQCRFHTTGSANYALVLRGRPNTAANHFYNPGVSPPFTGIRLLGIASGFSDNTVRNSFWMVDNLNGTQPPVADPGCQYTWVYDNGYALFNSFLKGAFGNNQAVAIEAENNIGNATLCIANTSNGHIKLISNNGANEWFIRMIASTGNLELVQTAGSGKLVLPAASGSSVEFAGSGGVSLGANDSGGTGYRVLRVPNA